ncbi:hypothetical protein ABK040_001810 [Willaertia magna]
MKIILLSTLVLFLSIFCGYFIITEQVHSILSNLLNYNDNNNIIENIDFYSLSALDIYGKNISMSNYRNKVLLNVNVASKCGLTPQYKSLQQLYNKYKDFEILAFPSNQFLFQEPASNEEICEFTKKEFNVEFKLFSKINVNGKDEHSIYRFLKKNGPKGNLTNDIKWNFTKFLVDKNGKVVKRYSPYTEPLDIEKDIVMLL